MGAGLSCEVERCQQVPCRLAAPLASPRVGAWPEACDERVLPLCEPMAATARKVVAARGQTRPAAVRGGGHCRLDALADADLDEDKRRLEEWLRGVLGHECREPPWARMDAEAEGHWLRGASAGDSGASSGGAGSSGASSSGSADTGAADDAAAAAPAAAAAAEAVPQGAVPSPAASPAAAVGRAPPGQPAVRAAAVAAGPVAVSRGPEVATPPAPRPAEGDGAADTAGGGSVAPAEPQPAAAATSVAAAGGGEAVPPSSPAGKSTDGGSTGASSDAGSDSTAELRPAAPATPELEAALTPASNPEPKIGLSPATVEAVSARPLATHGFTLHHISATAVSSPRHRSAGPARKPRSRGRRREPKANELLLW